MPDSTGSAVPCDLLVTAAWVITVDADRRILRDGAVAITGETIIAVGKTADLERTYDPARRIDRPDGVVLPGMTNGHRHLLCCAKGAMPEGGTTLESLRRFIYPSFSSLEPEDMYVYARHATAEMIRNGTTLFEEPGCNHIDAVLEAIAESGIRARIGLWTWDQRGAGGAEGLPDWLKLDTPAAIRRLEEGLAKVQAFGNPRIRPAVCIEGVTTCSDELSVAAARLAEESRTLAVQHKSTSEREVALELKVFGERPVKHTATIGALNEYTLLNHVTSLDDDDVKAIADNGATISWNPSTALKLAKGTTQHSKFPELIAAGVRVGLGTDAENCSNHQDVCRAIYLAALLPRDAREDPTAVSAETAVELGTLGGARALRFDDVTGSLEAGKQADLVIFDTNDYDWRPLHNPIANLAYGVTGHSVETVLIGGKVVLENKRSTIFDEDALREEIEATDRKILKKIGIDPAPAWPVL
ncbi:Cytosine/adenosine deaminase [Pseudonocardia thermophila]|jgi:Cytosine deaminase and related metal-dependent hydrolases|uniref:Cytosine/adenosine deaminase n=1 Tax=Pseudonocardia thermophila TaxID=1848 RepID=A0A1M6P6P0_PSETH|nr:amidohydrolase family protein [Pseudonocardia thermophila]SHK03560.1 Cytosine/adenosine deaminase [Pseudonocardia thermophila]